MHPSSQRMEYESGRPTERAEISGWATFTCERVSRIPVLYLRLSAGGTASANRDPKIVAHFSLFKRLIELRIYGFSIAFRYIISWFWIFRLELDLLWIESIQVGLVHNKSISNQQIEDQPKNTCKTYRRSILRSSLR